MTTARASFLLLLIGLLPAPALGQAQQWQRLTDDEAAAAGWSRERLAPARDYAKKISTEAVFIVAGGKVLDAWGPIDRKFNVHSIRKSYMSALYGIQVHAGKIKLNATMADLGIDDNEPSLTEVEKKATMHDLLKARSGVYHPALYETAGMKASRPERHSHKPGEFWYYNNWDFNALGTIYEQLCGTGIYEDFKRLIADPIGMEDYLVADGKYVTGADSIHRAYPFRMTARDMARFGLLFLRDGKWNGKQVVPEQWVKESLTSYSNAGSRGGYGYLWWVERDGVHLPGVKLPAGSFSARGAGGHFILVVPSLDLVIVHRVNTDVKERRVETKEFGELTSLILQAHESNAEPKGRTPAALLPHLMKKHNVPGAAVVEIRGHRIAAETYRGVLDATQSEAVDAHTIFEAASMTKPLAAYAALKLVEQGKLDLDRPLNKYLPKPYLPNEPMHAKITARMVMTHTSGFPNWRPKPPNDTTLKVMHEPGTAFRYSGEGFQFLQRAMEAITGTDLESHMQSTLLWPLGMSRSSLIWQADRAANAAAGHDANGKLKENRRHYSHPNAAFTLYCTPRDYAAFVLEIMKSDRGAEHSLKAETINLMLEPASPPTGRALLARQGRTGEGEIRYGLGWQIEPTPSGPRVRHSGSNGTGFRSYVEFDPARGDGIIIMTNAEGGANLWKELVEAVCAP